MTRDSSTSSLSGTNTSKRIQDDKNHILDIANHFKNRSLLRADYSSDLGKLSVIQQHYWEAESLSLTKKAELEEAEKDRDELSKIGLDAFARDQVANNFGINQIEQWTYGKSQELRASIDGLKPANPDRIYIEERMKLMNDYLTSYKERVSDETIKNLTDKRKFELDTAYVKAKNAYDSATSTADHFEVELESANEEATKVSEGIFEANELTFSLNQLRDRLASIDNRIDDVVLQAKSPLPVVIDRIPAPPIRPASSSTAKLRLIVFVFSFGLVGGVCLLFDFVDDRIRSREELSAAIGGSGCEPIPALGDAEDACFATILRDSPSSPAAIAIRDLALRIVLEMERADARIIAFAPACGRSGNTTLALNVARVVSARGFKVLVAELPGDSPGLARAAGLPGGEVPPSPWENKQVDPESAVELIPWVREVGEQRARLSLNAFFENARSAYDCVILDMPPPIQFGHLTGGDCQVRRCRVGGTAGADRLSRCPSRHRTRRCHRSSRGDRRSNVCQGGDASPTRLEASWPFDDHAVRLSQSFPEVDRRGMPEGC